VTNLQLGKERKIKLFFFLITIFAVGYLTILTQHLFITFLLSLVTFFLLAPLVDFFERKGVPRVWAALIPFLVFCLLVTLFLVIFTIDLGAQLKNIQSNFPRYTDSFNAFLQKINTLINQYTGDSNQIDLVKTATPYLARFSQDVFSEIPNYLSQSLTMLLLVPFIGYFMLLEGRKFVRDILSLVPNNFFETSSNLTHQIGEQIGGYIRARLIEGIMIFIIVWVGLVSIGFPYAFVLGFFAGVVNIIPYLGPLIGMVPAIIIYFSEPQLHPIMSWWAPVLVYIAAQIIDSVLIVPFIVAKIVDQHPVAVVLSVIVGSQLFGVLGMIISIPIYSVIKVTYAALYRHFTDSRA
jgi:putative permease